MVMTPNIEWHKIDPKVQITFVPTSQPTFIPDGDILFATSWHTVPSVLNCPDSKGVKCYFIQSYEVWQGPRAVVDATWKAPLRKVAISKSLVEIGKGLGCTNITYIPNGIDQDRYRLVRAIEGRERIVAMMCSPTPLKGSIDGVQAMEMARARFPEVKFICFGISARPRWCPNWIEYHHNPSQDFLIEEIYNKAAVLISSSWTEGFALPPAEAAACGCAIVATDSGGIRDFIEDGVTGLLSPPKNPAALAENLCLVLGDEALRVRLAEAANTRIKGFNWEHSNELMEFFIRQVAKSPQERMREEITQGVE
jgi:glycosyltransferase involved in cell wall biosynthesis